MIYVIYNIYNNLMYDQTLLVPMNQRVSNKLSKERNIRDHKFRLKAKKN